MDETQGREEIPLDDFGRDTQNDNDDWNNYDEESGFGGYNIEEYRNYEKEFDWRGYTDEKLNDRERERILLKNFLQDRKVYSKFDRETDKSTKSIISEIKDPNLKRNIINEIALRESRLKGGVKRIGNEELREIIVKAIDKTKFEDDLFGFQWDKEIVNDDKEKFYWEQKVNNLNQAFRYDDVYIDPTNENIYSLVDKELKNEYDLTRTIILGYNYKGKSIIFQKNGIYNTIDSPELNEFMDKVREEQVSTAKSIFSDYLNTDNDTAIKQTAKDYIKSLREEQKEEIRKRSSGKIITTEEVQEAIRKLNESNKIINDIKKNRKFNLKLRSVSRTIGRFIRGLYRFLRKHPKVFGSLALTAVSAVVSFVVGLEQLKGASQNILDGVKDYVKKNIVDNKDSILKYISNIPLLGENIKKLLSFLGLESISLLYLIVSLFFTTSTWALFLFTGISLISLTKSAEILEYVKLLSCQVVEQDYLVNKRKRPPKEISKNIADHKKITLEEYYKEFDGRLANVKTNSSNIVYSVMSSLASLNVLITSFVAENYTMIMTIVVVVIVIITIKIVGRYRK